MSMALNDGSEEAILFSSVLKVIKQDTSLVLEAPIPFSGLCECLYTCHMKQTHKHE